MLQKFAMVKYGVFVAKICKHALCASAVRDIWWSPLARQLLPPCLGQCSILNYKIYLECSQLQTGSEATMAAFTKEQWLTIITFVMIRPGNIASTLLSLFGSGQP